MNKLLKEIFRLIFEDLTLQLKTYLTILAIILLSYIPVKFIDDPVITMSVVGIIIVTVLYFSFFYERKKQMSIPAHIWLTDENNSPLIGECLMSTRLGSTELKSFNHSVWIPTDHNTGKITGTRLHVPITFEKK